MEDSPSNQTIDLSRYELGHVVFQAFLVFLRVLLPVFGFCRILYLLHQLFSDRVHGANEGAGQSESAYFFKFFLIYLIQFCINLLTTFCVVLAILHAVGRFSAHVQFWGMSFFATDIFIITALFVGVLIASILSSAAETILKIFFSHPKDERMLQAIVDFDKQKKQPKHVKLSGSPNKRMPEKKLVELVPREKTGQNIPYSQKRVEKVDMPVLPEGRRGTGTHDNSKRKQVNDTDVLEDNKDDEKEIVYETDTEVPAENQSIKNGTPPALPDGHKGTGNNDNNKLKRVNDSHTEKGNIVDENDIVRDFAKSISSAASALFTNNENKNTEIPVSVNQNINGLHVSQDTGSENETIVELSVSHK